MVEEGQDVVAAAPQGAAELGDLVEPGGHGASDRLDQRCHRAFTATAVRVGVGGDDLLVDHIRDLDGEVLLDVEHAGQAVVLASGEQLQAGSGEAPDPIQRVTGVPAPAEGLVLDALAHLGNMERTQLIGLLAALRLPRAYSRLLQAFAAIREADSGAFIVLGGLATLETAGANLSVGDFFLWPKESPLLYVDAVAVHPCTFPYPASRLGGGTHLKIAVHQLDWRRQRWIESIYVYPHIAVIEKQTK